MEKLKDKGLQNAPGQSRGHTLEKGHESQRVLRKEEPAPGLALEAEVTVAASVEAAVEIEHLTGSHEVLPSDVGMALLAI